MTSFKKWNAVVCAVLALAVSIATAEAKYPEKTITIVVSATPGNANDILARLVATKLSPRFQQNVIVENRPGAGTTLGAAYVARSKPDGYTLMLHSTSLTTAQVMYKNPGFDVERDFAPVGIMAVAPMGVITNSEIPAKTLAEFIAYAKKNDGKLNFGSAGGGSIMHINAELFRLKGGFNAVHVPYQGGAPSVMALMTNQIQYLVIDVASVLAGVQANKLRVLAVGSPERAASLPEVPTTTEAGFPFEAVVWYGLFAPAATPSEILRTLQEEVSHIVADPVYRRDMGTRGWQTPMVKPDEFKTRISSEIAKWREVVTAAKLQPQ